MFDAMGPESCHLQCILVPCILYKIPIDAMILSHISSLIRIR